MHPDTRNSLSVVVARDWLEATWRVTWYVIAPDGRLILDGRRDYPDTLHDAHSVEQYVADLYVELLKLV